MNPLHQRFTGLAGVLLMTAACSSEDAPETRQSTEAPQATSASAAAPGPFASAAEAREIVQRPGAVVLYVGSAADHESARIPGARLLPLDALRREVGGVPVELPPTEALDSVFEALGVGDDGDILLYGEPLPAARALFTLDVLGHGERVSLLDGGLEGWSAAGNEVESGPAEPPSSAAFTPRPRMALVVDAEEVGARLGAPGVVLIDARPEAQYTGAEAGDAVDRAGHIPGAKNLFWEEMLTGDGTRTLLPEDSLRALFSAAGVQPGDTVVTYCRTGMQASFAYAVARSLGYDTRMYDGSMVDWTTSPDRPVERTAQ